MKTTQTLKSRQLVEFLRIEFTEHDTPLERDLLYYMLGALHGAHGESDEISPKDVEQTLCKLEGVGQAERQSMMQLVTGTYQALASAV